MRVGPGRARDPVRSQRGDLGRADPRGHRAGRGGVVPSQLARRPDREQALEPVPPDGEDRQRACRAGEGHGLLPARPARASARRRICSAVRVALGREVHGEVVDADKNPLLARQYNFETYGTIVLETTLPDGQKKQEKIQDADEEKLTNAIIRVTRSGKRVVYFLKGHGEKDLSSSERTGYGQMKSAIEKLNYDVKDLLLAREPKVPDDATIGRGRAPEGAPAYRDRGPGRLRGPGRQDFLHDRPLPGRRTRAGPRAVWGSASGTT